MKKTIALIFVPLTLVAQRPVVFNGMPGTQPASSITVPSINVNSGSAGRVTIGCGTAPSAPAAGFVTDYCTSDVPLFKDPSGNVYVPVIGDTGASGQYISAISPTTGVITKSTPGAYTLQFQTGGTFSPLASTSYYFGGAFGSAPSTTAQVRRLYVGNRAGTITGAAVQIIVGGTLASAQTSTINIKVNNAAGVSALTGVVANTASPTPIVATGLNIAVAANDYIELEWATPAWTTTPTTVVLWGTIYVQ